jgi:regulator of sirC expression with transglutaminase-like and TPR domain
LIAESLGTFFSERNECQNLVELARLRIRYQWFSSATDIQYDLNNIMDQWQLSEDQIYAKTRLIHSKGKIY